MVGYFEFLGYHGCLGVFLRTVFLIITILWLIADVHNWRAWIVLVGEAIEVLLYISYRRIERKRYNRKDSYWSKKHDSEDIPKEK